MTGGGTNTGSDRGGAAGAGAARPTDAQLLDVFVELSRRLNLSVREEELVQLFAGLFERLLPGRLVAIRIADEYGEGLDLVWANGKLREGERDRFRATSAAVAEVDAPRRGAYDVAGPGRIEVSDSYTPVFVDGEAGFDIVLSDGESFYGMLNLEYPDRAASIEPDRALLLPLAFQLCAAIRNSRLMAQTIFLKDYLEKVLDSASAPVVVLDGGGRITVVNKAMESQAAVGRDELLGHVFLDLVPEPDRARLLPLVLNAQRGEPQTGIEVRLPRGDGRGLAHIAFNAASLVTGHGDVESLILVGQDLTEIRKLQKQVIHTEKLATLGQVAAGVAHELNNPLTSITVYANYLVNKLGETIDEQDLGKLRRIVEAAERIQSFTKDLVTYARPSVEEPTLVQVPDLIERALSFCEHLVRECGAAVTLEVAQGVRPVYGIRGQLEQVLVNLVTNACHALPSGGGRIRVSAGPVSDEQIEICVADTGCGIPEENLPELFEPFFSTKDQGEGTGLGLSIVKNILDNHNAEISVESEISKGSTFRIRMLAE